MRKKQKRFQRTNFSHENIGYSFSISFHCLNDSLSFFF
jgi:hypothetical protein